MEPGGAHGGDLVAVQHDAHLHQAQGTGAGLRRARHPALRGQSLRGGVLQSDPPDPDQSVQPRVGVGAEREAPAAAVREGPLPDGRGRGAAGEEGRVSIPVPLRYLDVGWQLSREGGTKKVDLNQLF